MFNRIINWFQSLFRFKTEPEQKIFKANDYQVVQLYKQFNDNKR